MDVDAIAALMWQLYTNAVAENVDMTTPLCDWERVPEKSKHAWKQLATLFAQPSTDSEPTQQLFPRAEKLVERVQDGQVLVPADICRDAEIKEAQIDGRYGVKADGYAVVLRLKNWLTSRELAHATLCDLAAQRSVIVEAIKLIPEVSGG